MKPISTAAEAGKALPPGLYSVAGAAGLYLQVSPNKTKSWALRYRLGSERRRMGLGSFKTVTLAEAHKAAIAALALRNSGVDPIDDRDAKKAALLSPGRTQEAQIGPDNHISRPGRGVHQYPQ